MKKDTLPKTCAALGAACLVFSLSFNCTKNPAKVVDRQDEIPSQMPQVDIPWPSLANSPWPMYLHDPQHTGRSPYRGPQEGKVEWMFATGNSVYSSPAIGSDGAIYFGSDDGFFYAVDPNGNLKWKFATDGLIIQSSPLISSDGTIYFSAWNAIKSQLYAIFAAGDLRWKNEIMGTGGELASSISKNGETIYTGHPGYAIFSLDAKTGAEKWKLDLLTAYVSAISPDGTTIYWGTHDGNLHAVDTSGTLKWKFNLGGPPSSPCIDNEGNIYINSGGYCYAISAKGTLRWKFNTFGHLTQSSPSIGKEGTIYTVGFAGTKLYALDYAGKLNWQFELGSVGGSPFDEKRSENTPIIDVDGTIYLGTLTERTVADSINFLAIDSDGTLKYAMSLRSPSEPGIPENLRVPDIDSTPAISADGKIYVGSDRPRGFHVYKIK